MSIGYKIGAVHITYDCLKQRITVKHAEIYIFSIYMHIKKIQIIAYFTHMLKFIKHEENLNYSFIYM